jgi:DNA-binding NtrC family response regulator
MANILIVDTYRTVGLLYQEILEEEGHRVLLAFSGKEAIDWAMRERIDVAVVDQRLTDIEADEVLQKLKQLQPQAQGTVCTVAGFGPVPRPDLCDDSFFKTSDYSELQEKIRKLLGQVSPDMSTKENGTE